MNRTVLPTRPVPSDQDPFRPQIPWKSLSALLAVLLVLGCGCGRKETYRTKEGEVKIDQKAGQTTLEANTKDGKVKLSAGESGVALPEGFPKDVPIYKGATVQMAMAQGKQMVVHLQVAASPAEGVKYYQDGLKGNGWEIEATMNMGEMAMVHAKKAQRKCMVTVHKQEKGTLVQIAVEPGEP
jgi:hypothetical protein